MPLLLPAAVVAAPVVLAAGEAASAGGFNLTSIITGGLTPLAFVMLMLTKKIAPGWLVDTLTKENGELRSELRAQTKQMINDVVPALAQSQQTTEQVMPFLQAEILIRNARQAADRGGL